MKWKRNPDIVYRDEDADGALLFNPDRDDIFSLNPAAKAIWEHVESVNAGDYAFMRDLFDDLPPDAELRKDIDELIAQLVDLHALLPDE